MTMSVLRLGMCQLRNNAAGMSSNSIREFMVMMNTLEVSENGGWIRVNVVEGVLKPALSSNWLGRPPPAISPIASVIRNSDPFAKAALLLSLRASRIVMNPKKSAHPSAKIPAKRAAPKPPRVLKPSALTTTSAETTTRSGPSRPKGPLFVVDTEEPPIRVDGRTSPVRWEPIPATLEVRPWVSGIALRNRLSLMVYSALERCLRPPVRGRLFSSHSSHALLLSFGRCHRLVRELTERLLALREFRASS